MKVLSLFAAGLTLVVSTPAFALHCEGQINSLLDIYSANKSLGKPINASDFRNGAMNRVVPIKEVMKASVDSITKNYVNKIEVRGASDGEKLKPVSFAASGYHKNPTMYETALVGPTQDLKVSLNKDCVLESFEIENYVVNGTKYTRSTVNVPASECLAIFKGCKLTNNAIFASLKKDAGLMDVYVRRVIPNCRRKAVGSNIAENAVPAMARLSGSLKKLTELCPPPADPDNPGQKREWVDSRTAQ